ncbi:MAG: O-antigen ligase family protein [Pseudomonadota bacterium]|nr:O-antigen ligase family protein [Pseudomonadota bacterium]
MFRRILLISESFFPRSFSQKPSESGLLDSFIYFSLPLVLITYFISIGVSSSLDESVSAILLLLGLFLIIKNKGTFAPRNIQIIYRIGLLLSLMVVVHAVLGNNLEMLFEFQFANFRNMLILPLIAALIVLMDLTAQGIWRLIVLSGSYTTILSILILIEGSVRSQSGYLEEAIVTGNVGMLFGMLALTALFGIKGSVWKGLALLVFFSGVALSLLSGSRGGWLALLLGYFFLVWGLWGVNKRAFLGLISVLFISLLILYVFWDVLPVQNRINLAVDDIVEYLNGNSNTSVGGRFDMWKVAVIAFTENPFWGWGVVPFKETFIEYANQGVINFDLAIKNGFAQPHNDYLFVMYHFGIVGFLLVMALLTFPIYVLIKAIKEAKTRKNNQMVYIGLTGLIALETLMEMMLSNLALMNEIFYVVITVLFMVLFVLDKGQRIRV